MKIEVLLLLVCFTSARAVDPIKAPLSVISYDDISPVEREHLAYLEEMNKQRAKRSGHSLLAILGNGLKSKLSSLAKASASSSAHFSSGSSGHYHPEEHDHHDDHDYEHEHKSFDFWSLNKAILNTLLQAVKAIKGATIALTGKLIKGSGYLVSAKGKLISHGGDAVTNWGKKVATSAILSPIAHGSHSSSYSDHSHEEYHNEYSPSGHQDAEVAPSGIASEYSSAPDLSNKYLPGKYSNYEADKKALVNQLPEGIIILKKIPKGSRHIEAQGSENVPDFKPLDPHTPGYREMLGGLLASASDSNSGPSNPTNSNAMKSRFPLESPTVDYLRYFKANPTPHQQLLNPLTNPTLNSVKLYDTLMAEPETDFSNFNTPLTTYQTFSSEPFITELDTIPAATSQFSTEFSQDVSSLGAFGQLHDPRSLSNPKGPFLPTPLSQTDLAARARASKRPDVDVVKSITYQLRPNGPVKI